MFQDKQGTWQASSLQLYDLKDVCKYMHVSLGANAHTRTTYHIEGQRNKNRGPAVPMRALLPPKCALKRK